jgi:hypothetical protein
MVVRVLPDGPTVHARGRQARTLRALLREGERGVTSGDLSVWGWGFRASDYVHKLRRAGLPILTTRVRLGDARIGVYTLEAPIEVQDEGDEHDRP